MAAGWTSSGGLKESSRRESVPGAARSGPAGSEKCVLDTFWQNVRRRRFEIGGPQDSLHDGISTVLGGHGEKLLGQKIRGTEAQKHSRQHFTRLVARFRAGVYVSIICIYIYVCMYVYTYMYP